MFATVTPRKHMQIFALCAVHMDELSWHAGVNSVIYFLLLWYKAAYTGLVRPIQTKRPELSKKGQRATVCT